MALGNVCEVLYAAALRMYAGYRETEYTEYTHGIHVAADQ